MPDPLFTTVNRMRYSWNSCAHFLAGFPYKGITGVTFKETREVTLVHAAQQDGTPLGMTAGMYKVENVSFTMLRETAAGFMADLTLLGLGSFGDAQFNYVLQLFEPPNPTDPVPSLPQTTLIVGCRITGVEDKQESGTDALVTEFTCMAMAVTRTLAGVPLQLWSAARTLLP